MGSVIVSVTQKLGPHVDTSVPPSAAAVVKRQNFRLLFFVSLLAGHFS
jgi:hypothetical protein